MTRIYLVVENRWNSPDLPYIVLEAFTNRKKAWKFLRAQTSGRAWVQTWTPA